MFFFLEVKIIPIATLLHKIMWIEKCDELIERSDSKFWIRTALMKGSVYIVRNVTVQVIFLASKSSSPIELLNLYCWSVDVFKMSWKFYHNAFVSIMQWSCGRLTLPIFEVETRRLKETCKLLDGVEKYYYGIDIEYMHQECCQVPEERRLDHSQRTDQSPGTRATTSAVKIKSRLLILFW